MIGVSAVSVIRNKKMFVNGLEIFHSPSSLPDWCDDAYKHFALGYPKFFKMDTLSKLGILAVQALLEKGSIQSSPIDVALLFSNSEASADADLRYHASIEHNPSPSLFVYTLPNIVMGEVCIKFGFKGEQTFFVTPQFDAGQLVNYASLVLAKKHVHACVVGWVDVFQEHHDVFLYLVQKNVDGVALHTPEHIKALYYSESYGTINSRS